MFAAAELWDGRYIYGWACETVCAVVLWAWVCVRGFVEGVEGVMVLALGCEDFSVTGVVELEDCGPATWCHAGC